MRAASSFVKIFIITQKEGSQPIKHRVSAAKQKAVKQLYFSVAGDIEFPSSSSEFFYSRKGGKVKMIIPTETSSDGSIAEEAD